LLLLPRFAAASGFDLFQHGGRATCQAGASTARASDPSAVYYNPAAIARLRGLQLEAGLDFENPTDTYRSPTGGNEASHVIQFPPSVYLTWHAAGGSPIALGFGIDSPFYSDMNWDTALFQGRFLTRRFQLQIFEAHPVVAYELSDALSVGGGVRYAYGSMKQGDNAILQANSIPFPRIEVKRDANSNVHGYAFDLALHYARPAWGWGAVYRSSENLKGSGDADYEARDVPEGVPGLPQELATRFARGSVSQSFRLPDELRGGVWVAPYPELRVELDGSFERWSGIPDTSLTFNPDPFGDGPTVTRRRDWKDTLNLRLGVEGNVNDTLALFGGFGLEPSPVPSRTLEPGFPRGDAKIYAAGFTYNFPQISFDVGYSIHQY